MEKESFWAALWRANRILPIITGGLLLVNLVVAGLAVWVVAPRLAASEQAYLARQQEYRDARSGEVDNSPAGIYRRGRRDIKTFLDMIPEQASFTGLLKDLFGMAGKAGLAIDQVTYDPSPVKNEELLSYTLSFSVSGDYGKVKKFIFLIEHSPRVLVIDELNLKSVNEKLPGQITLGLRLTTYFRTPAT